VGGYGEGLTTKKLVLGLAALAHAMTSLSPRMAKNYLPWKVLGKVILPYQL